MTACAPCMAVGADVEAGAGTPALSDAFFDALARMGLRRGTNPEHYLVVWCAESGLDPTAVNPKGGARGLNQMMPATLRGLGAPANYEMLPGEAHLPWIERLIADGEAREARKVAIRHAKERCRSERIAARERARALRLRGLAELREAARLERKPPARRAP